MIVHMNQISPNLKDADAGRKVAVSVPCAREGNVSNVMVGDTTMDCAVQRETGSSIVYSEAEARQLNIDETELPEDNSLSPADFISRCMTGEDAEGLSEEGTPLEEYTSSQLERAVRRVKEQRTENREAVEAQVSREQEKREVIEASAEEGIAEEKISREVLEIASESGLAVVPENVSRLAHAVDLTAGLLSLTPASMKYFIENEWDITPEHVSASAAGAVQALSQPRGSEPSREQKTQDIPPQGWRLPQGAVPLAAAALWGRKTAGEQIPPESVPEDTFFQIRHQVEDILLAGGLEVTADNVDTARWLYENDLPVTADNIKLYCKLEELKETDPAVVAARIADDMVDGMMPEKADLTRISVREAEMVVEDFSRVPEEDIVRTYPAEVDQIRARRQLEEIRLSMTVQAARNMSAKGIELDISHLEQIVEGLRQQEQQVREDYLVETGLPVTETNKEIVYDTVEAAKNVLSAPVEILGSTLSEGGGQTLARLADTAVEAADRFNRMEQTYEAVGTQVRTDLGDSIQKAFGNIDTILEDLNLEVNGRNQRAVRILGYNQMEITRENIALIKEYDVRVTTLMENMTPPVVAKLVQDRINPLELTIDELNVKVQEIQENVVTEDIPFRKFLWKMDHQGGFTSEERQSMIGVYRLLDKVEKSDGAVIGQVAREGKVLSLYSLLSAVRSKKAEGMDLEVDDDFGGLTEIKTSGTSISEQIGAAYGKTLTKQLKRTLDPQVLKRQRDEGLDISLEKLLELCETKEEDEGTARTYYQHMVENVRNLFENMQATGQEFLEALDMPDNVMNLEVLQSWMRNGNREYASMWKKEDSEKLVDILDQPEELEDFYAEIDRVQTDRLTVQREQEDVSYNEILSIARMANSISFYRNIRHRQIYEVPLVTERGITTCNVTIQGGRGDDKGTVEISMCSEEMGHVQATYKVSGKRVKGFVTAENADSIDICSRILNGFEKDLEENGFTMESESLMHGNRRSLHAGDKSDGTKNRDLYQVAKLFIANVNGKEDEI